MSDGFGCLLTTAGAVLCWGGNTVGELGTGSMMPSATPVAVPGLGSGVTYLSANGGTQACAVLAGGDLRCWGNGIVANSTSPVDAQGLPGPVRSISVGGEACACAIGTGGKVYCWGGTCVTNAWSMAVEVPTAEDFSICASPSKKRKSGNLISDAALTKARSSSDRQPELRSIHPSACSTKPSTHR